MAYTYIGQLSSPYVSQSYWNGTSWSAPTITVGPSPCGLGTRQGLDPLPSGSWDKRSFRINPVRIIRETRYSSDLVIAGYKPHPSWGANIKGPVLASYWMVPEKYLPSTYTFSDSIAQYVFQKTLAKLHGADFDAGTNLGELRETLSMLRNPLQGIRTLLVNTVRNLRKGKNAYGGPLKNTADAASSTLLEFRYGVRPLISTVEDLLELYRNGLSTLDAEKLYRKRSTVEKSSGTTLYDDVPFMSFQARRSIAVTAKEKYTCGVYYKYTAPPTLQERMGLDILSLPGIAWELTGWSFVWDWFLGIGNWIESLRAEVNRSIAGAYVSHKLVHTVKASFIPGSLYVVGQPTWRPAFGDPEFTSVTELLERKAMSLPTGFSLPALNPNDLGILRQLDSLALLWQKLPKR